MRAPQENPSPPLPNCLLWNWSQCQKGWGPLFSDIFEPQDMSFIYCCKTKTLKLSGLKQRFIIYYDSVSQELGQVTLAEVTDSALWHSGPATCVMPPPPMASDPSAIKLSLPYSEAAGVEVPDSVMS